MIGKQAIGRKSHPARAQYLVDATFSSSLHGLRLLYGSYDLRFAFFFAVDLAVALALPLPWCSFASRSVLSPSSPCCFIQAASSTRRRATVAACSGLAARSVNSQRVGLQIVQFDGGTFRVACGLRGGEGVTLLALLAP